MTFRGSLIRTGSVPVQNSFLPSSPRVRLTRRPSFTADTIHLHSPKISMHYSHSNNGIHRTSSDADKFSLHPTGSRSLSPIIPDNEQFFSVGVRSEDLEFGGGDGRDLGGASLTGGNGGERMKIGAYYEEMLKLNPTDALLLRNYAKYLHEVRQTVPSFCKQISIVQL